MTQGRATTSKVRSAKAVGRKTAGKGNAAKASRKKSAVRKATKDNQASPSRKAPGASKTAPSAKAAVRGKNAARKSTARKSTARKSNSAGKIKPQGVKAPKASTRVVAAPQEVAQPKPVVGSKQSKKVKPASARRPVQLGLGFDDKQDTLAVLQQQNRRLMQKIAKRRASLALLRKLSEELMQQASQRVVPYRDELKALTRELLDLESSVLGAEQLVGRKRDQVRLVFHDLLKDLPLDELDADDDDDSYDDDSATASAAPGEGVESARGQGGTDAEGEGVAAQDEVSRPESPKAQQSSATSEQARTLADAAQPEARSADKPSGDQSGALRSLFKRLVIQWHPDRVRDEVQKAERTKLMKEFTQAFESGDLATLVALEQTLAMTKGPGPASTDTPEKRAEQLHRSNAELLKQLEELHTSLEAVREDCPFALDYRKKDPASVARDELDQFVLMNHMAVQRAAETRDFVLSFARGQMKLADFLQGASKRRARTVFSEQ